MKIIELIKEIYLNRVIDNENQISEQQILESIYFLEEIIDLIFEEVDEETKNLIEEAIRENYRIKDEI